MQPLPCILQRITHFVHPLSRTRVFIDTPEHPQELEGNRVVKGAQIQPRGALDFVQAINQCIAVDIKLSCSLRNVQMTLKELIDGLNHFFIEHAGVALAEQRIIIPPQIKRSSSKLRKA